MDSAIFGLNPGTLGPVLIVGAVTVVVLTVSTAFARRWHSYGWLSIAFVIAGCAGLALGSFLAVRILMGTFDSMSEAGGGIGAVWFGIWEATQPLLAAAWLAVASALLAGVFVLPHAKKELTPEVDERRPGAATFAWLAALAFAAGVAPVLLFRRAVTFVLWAITPESRVTAVAEAIENRLRVTATVSACCFLILIVLVVATVLLGRRSHPSRFLFGIAVIALVVSLGLSAVLLVDLPSFMERFREAALTGRMPSP